MVKSHTTTRLDRQLAFIIGAATFGLLLRNVAPDLLGGDSGEFQFAAWHWGLAHPTGYPLYLLLGGLWQRLWNLLGISPAYSLNALSAVFAAITAGLFYWLLVRWLPGRPAAVRLAAGLGVAFLVANPTFRSQSLVAEVYSLHTLLVVAILIAAQRLVDSDAGASATGQRATAPFVILSLLLGLSFTHHATTVLLVLPLLIYLWLADRGWWRRGRAWLWAAAAFALPLLLYLYIPLRSGVDASPWYHQRLGSGAVNLYDGSWQALINYVTGRSISVGFNTIDQALAAGPTALVLWLRHFEWPGLLLTAVGIFVIVRVRAWAVLGLTLSYFALHLVFNLFYAIGDIFVYYIPLYLVACIWIGFGAAGIGAAFHFEPEPTTAVATPGADGRPNARQVLQGWATAFLVVLYAAPMQMWIRYTPLVEQIQTASADARVQWENILGAEPPDGAVLISNDRNEIVPLFYLQTVEKRALGYTGLFPLMAPDARFADIGATIQTALDAGAGQPVYLIKEMPGLQTRFAVEPRTPPLYAVTGPAVTAAPGVVVNQAYGPLQLLGYDVTPQGEDLQIDLHWQVTTPLADKYTTTVQLFDASGAKIGQSDYAPGGDYYSTKRWKPGETLLDRHSVAVAPGTTPARILIGMYSGADARLLAPALELPFASTP